MARNPYQGVNVHLFSRMLARNSFSGAADYASFHNAFINSIADFLNQVLPNNYLALTERSLQIRLTYPPDAPVISRPRPDVVVTGYGQTATAIATPASTAALEDTLDTSEDFMNAALIAEIDDERQLHPITRIELLSPSNMQGESGYAAYRKSRNQALESGTPLIEINLLHTYVPPLFGVPIYRETATAPTYAIYVSDPRPTISEGRFQWYGFSVDESFPSIVIPLAGAETLHFHFEPVYQHTFLAGRWSMLTDPYTQLPAEFDSYHEDDQARIRTKMVQIAEMANEKRD